MAIGWRWCNFTASCCRELVERYPELRAMTETVVDAADLCDLAMTLEETEN
jgi:hypothetical protein